MPGDTITIDTDIAKLNSLNSVDINKYFMASNECGHMIYQIHKCVDMIHYMI